ncbi:hypothetical protein EV141_0578 [Microcella putealis]|uniref:CopC domain-containing protein n=1 Tax=Microcella putealis TaxID=337005 RepID=A0A4Q7LY08_9MICO|nr:copper resistance CopC family protein [Microcella putealis]RZS59357.1 hypothetical protein EV141_0578 [Microcella putealis]TQM19982.1 hypothetical protein BJ957_2115 [Microcella putealis]
MTTTTLRSLDRDSRAAAFRTTLGSLAAVGAAALLSLAAVSPASAHNFVVSTTPGEGASITEVPERFDVVTNEEMLDIAGDGTGFALQVTDAAGQFYGDGCLAVDGATLSMPATLGEAGTYTLAYQFISSDSHTLSGEFTFDYAPTGDAVVTPGSPEPLSCGDPIPGAADPAPSEVPDAPASDEPAASEEPTPTPSDTADAQATSDDGGLPVAATVGIAVGALALLAAIIGGILYARRRRA